MSCVRKSGLPKKVTKATKSSCLGAIEGISGLISVIVLSP